VGNGVANSVSADGNVVRNQPTLGGKEFIVAGEAGRVTTGYWTITVALIVCEGPPLTDSVIGMV
jgi:hypothetical protein